MRKKLITILLILCLAAALVSPAALADGDVYFTATNDTLQPLSGPTMPAYIDGVLYLPYSVFTTSGFDIYYSVFNSGDIVCLYSSGLTLFFDMTTGTSFSGTNDLFEVAAYRLNGTVYMPAYFTCGLFGLSCSVISSTPAPIVRIISGSASYSNTTFASIYKSQMEAALNEYNGAGSSDHGAPSHKDVTLLLSFRLIPDGSCSGLLDILDENGIAACFFVTSYDILNGADLIRRICGSGHSVGIYLETGTFEEYEHTSALLYEAAKAVTLIVASPTDVGDTARSTAEKHGLLYCQPGETFDSDATEATLIKGLSTLSGNRQMLMFACGEGTLSAMPQFLLYIIEVKYSIRQINETIALTPEI